MKTLSPGFSRTDTELKLKRPYLVELPLLRIPHEPLSYDMHLDITSVVWMHPSYLAPRYQIL